MTYRMLIIMAGLTTLFITSAQAAGSGLVPRVSYNISHENSPTFIGDNVYLGLIQLNAHRGGIRGFSLRYAWGDRGEKYNLSYMIGSPSIAFEIGISQIQQYSNTPAMFKGKHEGQAIELSLRYMLAQFILIASEEHTTFEVGVGF